MPTILKPECTCHGWAAPSCPIHGINAREAAILRRVNEPLEAPATATPESDGIACASAVLRSDPRGEYYAMGKRVSQAERERDAALALISELREALKGANAQKARLREALQGLIDECRVHRTSPPDYAWSECICGGEDKHERDCPVEAARTALNETGTKTVS